jgi:hypothetical protein
MRKQPPTKNQKIKMYSVLNAVEKDYVLHYCYSSHAQQMVEVGCT